MDVEVVPSSIRVGESARVFASAYDAEGEPVTSFWARLVVGGRGAVAGGDGQSVVGRAPGTAKVTLVVDRPAARGQEATTLEASTTIEVLPARITHIEIDLPTTELLLGARYPARARASTAFGVREDAQVTWGSGSESVLSVSSNGTLVARSSGTARVVAQSEGVSSEIEVRVRDNPIRGLTVMPEETAARRGGARAAPATRCRPGECPPPHSLPSGWHA